MAIPIKLNKKEIAFLQTQRKGRNLSLRKYNRINILLLLHKGKRLNSHLITGSNPPIHL